MDTVTHDRLDSVRITYQPSKSTPGPQTVVLSVTETDPDEAVQRLREMANNIENGLLCAGLTYAIVLTLHGHDDGHPNTVGG